MNNPRKRTKATRSNELSTCQVYAIRLSPSVLADPKFKAANPGYRPNAACYFIGMSSLPPAERVAQHWAGINASKVAHRHLLALDMAVVPTRKPTLRTWALKHERQLAKDLRAQGLGIWQA